MLRQAKSAGFAATAFEQADRVGGIWVFDPATDDDPTGRDANAPVFSSLYESLRTNLPRDLMAFPDYTFDSAGGGDDNWQRFPHHSKVLAYLTAYATDHQLLPHIEFNTEVTAVEKEDRGWRLTVKTAGHGKQQQHFDAVAVCNGHYSKPRVPEIAGAGHFNGSWLHAHNYRNNQPFRGKIVALWGTAASGADISREIAQVAEQVYWCGDKFAQTPGTHLDGMILHDSPATFAPSGFLLTKDGAQLAIDTFVYCTGYEYSFPFLADTLLSVNDNCVAPLYLDIVPPQEPTLGFIGIPYLVVPFPLFDLQAKWFAGLLKGDVALPDRTTLDEYFLQRQQVAEPRHYHKLGDAQPAYMDLLAQQCGAAPTPAWFHALTSAAQAARLADPKGFRDKHFAQQGPTRIAQPLPRSR